MGPRVSRMNRCHVPVLVCPRCGSSLTLDGATGAGDSVEEGLLQCADCRRAFPVRGGVPRFTGDSYVRNFSLQWKRFADFEKFYDVDNRTYYSTGLGLTPEQVTGKRVLEVGCGSGRAVGHFLAGAPELLVAIDLSEAVDAVHTRHGSRLNLLVLQSDMAALPLRRSSFDVVYSYGVIHHTPDPRRYFSIISELVAPGGLLALWVYVKGRNYGVISNLVQRNSSRLPRTLLVPFCWAMTLLGYGLHLQSRIPVLKWFYPLNLHLVRFFFRITPSRHFWLNYLWAHDFHTTYYTSEHEPQEVYEWFEEAGFRDMKPLRLCGMIGRKR